MLSRFPDMRALISGEISSYEDMTVRNDETIGRPRGDAAFFKRLEKKTGRSLIPGKRGPRPGGRRGEEN
ncbi:MAG: hypothetical protein HC855_16690 [Rhizobiales bacterium]|nr:hypothetical protein [Hyphomicrobiales bacterium]